MGIFLQLNAGMAAGLFAISFTLIGLVLLIGFIEALQRGFKWAWRIARLMKKPKQSFERSAATYSQSA